MHPLSNLCPRIPSLDHNSFNHSAIKGLFVNSVVKYKQLGKQGWLTVWINLRSADLSILAFIYVILAQLKLIKPVFCRSSDFFQLGLEFIGFQSRRQTFDVL